MSWGDTGIGGVGRGGPNIPKPHRRIRLKMWWAMHGFSVLGWTIILTLIVATAFIIGGATQQKQNFMDGCLQERQQYECTAMWRGGY